MSGPFRRILRNWILEIGIFFSDYSGNAKFYYHKSKCLYHINNVQLSNVFVELKAQFFEKSILASKKCPGILLKVSHVTSQLKFCLFASIFWAFTLYSCSDTLSPDISIFIARSKLFDISVFSSLEEPNLQLRILSRSYFRFLKIKS